MIGAQEIPNRVESNVMIEFRLDEMLEARGRTAYWLSKETGLTHAALYRIRHAKSGAIKYDTLEKICRALECQPGDLLFMVDDEPKGSAKKKSKSK